MVAGYSGTPQLRKLGIVGGTTLAVLAKPRGWSFAEPLPDDVVRAQQSATTPVDVVLAFVREPAGLDPLPAWGDRIFPTGAIWVAWPRKAGGHVSDVTENLIRNSALALGLVDVKVAAIDEDWSGLKLVWRKELRAARG
ncbi:MAG: DUF3052 family protein [Actinomycetes bacterium]